MFTSSTRQFGNWRRNHPANLRGMPGTRISLLVALACCAAIAWTVFLVCLKIRVAFLPIETAPIALTQVSADEVDLKSARAAAFRGAVFIAPENALRLVFDDGSTFVWPEQRKELLAHASSRLDALELSELLIQGSGERLRRAQLWPARNVSLLQLQNLSADLSSLGVDEVDIAAEVVGGAK